MIDQGCRDFYDLLRRRPDLLAELMRIETRAALNEAVIEMGREQGYTLDPEAVRGTRSGEFLEMIAVAANDDELTDDELELVAAGLPVPCGDT